MAERLEGQLGLDEDVARLVACARSEVIRGQRRRTVEKTHHGAAIVEEPGVAELLFGRNQASRRGGLKRLERAGLLRLELADRRSGHEEVSGELRSSKGRQRTSCDRSASPVPRRRPHLARPTPRGSPRPRRSGRARSNGRRRRSAPWSGSPSCPDPRAATPRRAARARAWSARRRTRPCRRLRGQSSRPAHELTQNAQRVGVGLCEQELARLLLPRRRLERQQRRGEDFHCVEGKGGFDFVPFKPRSSRRLRSLRVL